MYNIKPLSDVLIADYFKLTKQIDTETNYLLLEKEERKYNALEAGRIKRDLIDAKHNYCFLAYDEDTPIGYVIGIGSTLKRKKHTLKIVIAIMDKYQGNGIGSRLLSTLEETAQLRGVSLFNLSVVIENINAVIFYLKNGYQFEGIERNSMFINGEFVSEYKMSKLNRTKDENNISVDDSI